VSKITHRRSFLAALGSVAGALPFLKRASMAQSEQHYHAKPEEISHAMADDPAIAAVLGQKVVSLQGLAPARFLTAFDYGQTSEAKGRRRVREFEIVASETRIEVAPGLFFDAWTYNGSVPGPTLRCTEGDLVRVHFSNKARSEHAIHFHGIHEAVMDGVSEPVMPGASTIYEFIAGPAGLQLYHCHTFPAALHINRGLFGAFIIDPPSPQPPAREMVMVLHGWDINFDRKNELYAMNGAVNFFRDNPVQLRRGEEVRLYLANFMEYEPLSSFHLHANFFKLYRTGIRSQAAESTDVVILGQAERCMLEFSYRFPGKYMFHPHQNSVAERGCMGHFQVS
jgi:manganese oxidase